MRIATNFFTVDDIGEKNEDKSIACAVFQEDKPKEGHHHHIVESADTTSPPVLMGYISLLSCLLCHSIIALLHPVPLLFFLPFPFFQIVPFLPSLSRHQSRFSSSFLIRCRHRSRIPSLSFLCPYLALALSLFQSPLHNPPPVFPFVSFSSWSSPLLITHFHFNG